MHLYLHSCPRQRIAGVKKVCEQSPKTHIRPDAAVPKCHKFWPAICARSNRYDGMQEYWVVIRESAEQTESKTHEESYRENKKVRFTYILVSFAYVCMHGFSPPTPLHAFVLDQVAPSDMPAADPNAFQGIDKHLEREQQIEAAAPEETVSAQIEAGLW